MKHKVIYRYYTSYVIDAVRDYFEFNEKQQLTKEDVQRMSRNDVLKYFLEWEGIIGYTGLIENIFECTQEIEVEEDD